MIVTDLKRLKLSSLFKLNQKMWHSKAWVLLVIRLYSSLKYFCNVLGMLNCKSWADKHFLSTFFFTLWEWWNWSQFLRNVRGLKKNDLRKFLTACDSEWYLRLARTASCWNKYVNHSKIFCAPPLCDVGGFHFCFEFTAEFSLFNEVSHRISLNARKLQI